MHGKRRQGNQPVEAGIESLPRPRQRSRTGITGSAQFRRFWLRFSPPITPPGTESTPPSPRSTILQYGEILGKRFARRPLAGVTRDGITLALVIF